MLEVGLHYNIGSLICEIVPDGASLGLNVLGVPIQCRMYLHFPPSRLDHMDFDPTTQKNEQIVKIQPSHIYFAE